MIDVVGNEESRERVRNLRIGDKVDSDHHPVEVEEFEKGWKQIGKRKERKEGVIRGMWNEEGCQMFKEKIGEIEMREEEIEKEWERVEEKLKEAMAKTEKEMRSVGRRRGR